MFCPACTTKAWICLDQNLNSEHVLGIPNTLFGIPDTVFGILNTYSNLIFPTKGNSVCLVNKIIYHTESRGAFKVSDQELWV